MLKNCRVSVGEDFSRYQSINEKIYSGLYTPGALSIIYLQSRRDVGVPSSKVLLTFLGGFESRTRNAQESGSVRRSPPLPRQS